MARSAREDRALKAAAFLSHSRTKSVSARSFVQDSGARSWALWIRRRRRRSQREERLRSLLVHCSLRSLRIASPLALELAS